MSYESQVAASVTEEGDGGAVGEQFLLSCAPIWHQCQDVRPRARFEIEGRHIGGQLGLNESGAVLNAIPRCRMRRFKVLAAFFGGVAEPASAHLTQSSR